MSQGDKNDDWRISLHDVFLDGFNLDGEKKLNKGLQISNRNTLCPILYVRLSVFTNFEMEIANEADLNIGFFRCARLYASISNATRRINTK